MMLLRVRKVIDVIFGRPMLALGMALHRMAFKVGMFKYYDSLCLYNQALLVPFNTQSLFLHYERLIVLNYKREPGTPMRLGTSSQISQIDSNGL